MDKLKLKWKIFAYLLGFCALLLIILWLFQTVFLRDMYKMIRRNEVNRAVAMVEKNIDSQGLQDIFRELEFSKGITVKTEGDFTPPEKSVEARHRKKLPETITEKKTFTLKDGSRVSLVFYAAVTPVEATVSTLKMQLVVITAIMVILATLLAVMISRRISRPIEQINQGAKALAAGNYEPEFDGRGFLEIRELSGTLNTAAVELNQVEKLRRELMANVSHDMRTPLALIYSYAEMMHDFPQEVTPDQSQVIMDETKRLTSLVNDVLDISTLETGKAGINKGVYNLTDSLRETVKRMGQLVKSQGIQIEFSSDEQVEITADKVKITQAFYNLLLNAITHGGSDHVITVSQRVNGDVVRVAVSDQGEGISPEDLPYIWDRYYKVDKTHKRPVTGTGLGLSIVKKIMDMHQGAYGVQSEVGQGSVFWFSLEMK